MWRRHPAIILAYLGGEVFETRQGISNLKVRVSNLLNSITPFITGSSRIRAPL
ncbi:hypothetical protein M408DRAFT_332437 [Serendipita vermifera MAFF 305830]|uniref:Uncharacterized protein n=1 Tax=Serendipita vermifera MAFF 305830 TaxID=933852 RepID=A0A0C2W9Y2_SERVB|nr:hypothetical protein M408DRAFT_332437 [Serendipita vermifera MAFF 305830]